MEFKVQQVTNVKFRFFCVNITRMEFKDFYTSLSDTSHFGVNITRMEFKVLNKLKGITAVNECKYNQNGI